MGTGDKILWVTLRWTSIPSKGGGGGVAIFLVALCFRNRALWANRGSCGLPVARVGYLWLVWVTCGSCGPLWLVCDFTFTSFITLIQVRENQPRSQGLSSSRLLLGAGRRETLGTRLKENKK